MEFSIIYEIGEAPEEADQEDFPDAEDAKAFASQSAEIGDIEWLGAYDCERGQEPVWTEDDG